MLINADFSLPAIVTPAQSTWLASPQPGVERIMLDRIGAEQARATSLVRYAPQSRFAAHTHPGGEEILVLSGTFSDEASDYPAGVYLRNPPGSRHQPFSTEGACIFVKLRQMNSHEAHAVRTDTADPSRWRQQGDHMRCDLFAGFGEQVWLEQLPAGMPLAAAQMQGLELLVLAGELMLDGQAYPPGSWLRLPAGNDRSLCAGSEGLRLYLKTGHLPVSPPARG